MNDENPRPSGTPTAVAVIALLVAGVFAALWLRERDRKPAEIVKEVPKPVQVVREVPVERIRTVPQPPVTEVQVVTQVEAQVRLTAPEQAALQFASQVVESPLLTRSDDALNDVEAFAVRVTLDSATRSLVTEAQMRGAFERVLQRRGLRLDQESPFTLALSYNGLLSADGATYTCLANLHVEEVVLINRGSDVRRCVATVWQDEGFDSLASAQAASAILQDAEVRAANFAGRYLNAQQQ